ncbi:MAG: transcriptional regulator [Leptonema illini]|uniref:Transcriptional regulator n=1 Tax=Leptonema illini TaxID=183 RepID=A0A833H018_9LEPT|nr:MAG: transcriptional regulator [Leptonema illini]
MISLRLPPDLEEKLTDLCNIENKTKTDILKESLLLYIKSRETEKSPYELGENYIGKYGSGMTDRSVNHKELIRQKLRKKQNA